MEGMKIWLTETRKRWPEARFITQGEFGLLWRDHYKSNETVNYRFAQRGSGVRGSIEALEVRWFMNKDFRLALQRNWKDGTPEKVIDFTRYDLAAREPLDPTPGNHTRNWSLINRINQKGLRPEDKPVPLESLSKDDREFIKAHYPGLFAKDSTE